MPQTCHAAGPLAGRGGGLLSRQQLRPAPLSWTRSFPGTAAHAQAARRFTDGLLMGSPLREDAIVVLSELFTNAVVHTESGKPGGLVTVQISRWRHGVQITVTDQGSGGAPAVCEPCGEPAEGGNGLFLVSCLASRLDWGEAGAGRTICAMLGSPPPGTAHPVMPGAAPAMRR